MRSSSKILVALIMAGALPFVGACAKSGAAVSGGSAPASSPAASPSPSVDPVAVLTASMSKSQATSAKFTIDSEVGTIASTQGSGQVDVATRSEMVTLTLKAAGKTIHEQVTAIGTDVYLKIDLPIPGVDGKKWLHLDATKLTSLTALGLGNPSDPASLSAYSKQIVTVQQTGPGQYQGTLDLTKAPLPSIASSVLAQAGDAIKSVPFVATTDDQSRLTSMTVNLPPLGTSAPASTTTIKFSDFGAPVTVHAPAKSQVQEAPAVFYSLFGG
jgi:hypothetical protein